jgi:hypothetical protein
MLSPPAYAKRFHTMGAYYAYLKSRSSARGEHSHRRDVRESSDTAVTAKPGRMQPTAPVPYQYAIGNAVANTMNGSLSTFDDRFCQPMTLQYLTERRL